MISPEIRNKERLIRPCDIPAVVELDQFIKDLDIKYGVDSKNEKNSFGYLDLQRPLVSSFYESNIYYALFGGSTDKCHLPKYSYQNKVNKVVTAADLMDKDYKVSLNLTEDDKQTLFGLRLNAYQAVKDAYPRKPVFSESDTTVVDYDRALQEQGFADGSHQVSERIFISKTFVFKIEYYRLRTNKSPYFSTTYKGWQNQEELPHNSMAYQFYRKWNPFQCIEMTINEFNEMMEDLQKLRESNRYGKW